MEYWIKGNAENGYGEMGILMKGSDERILSVVKNKEGIHFTEECDGYDSIVLSKEEAIKLVDELREWINT